MLRPVKMQKIRIVAVKSASRPLIAELHRLGMVEIRRFESEGFESGKTVEAYDRVSTSLVRLRSIKSMLGLKGTEGKAGAEMGLEETLAEAEAFGVDERVSEDNALIQRNEAEISRLEGRLSDLRLLSGFNIDFSELKSEALSFAAGTIPSASYGLLTKSLKGCRVDSRPLRNNMRSLLIAYPSGDESVELALGKFNFEQIDFEGFGFPKETAGEFSSRIAGLKNECEEAGKRISVAAKKRGPKLASLLNSLSLWSERTLITKEFGFGSQTLILEGWIKESDFSLLKKALESKFGTKVYLEALSKAGNEPVPVALDNPRSTYPFQFLVELFSLPKASEIDPTLVLLITVPIIYGMMLGDVVYGLVSFLFASWLIKKVSKGGLGYGVVSIWRFSALSGILFGIIFDEWMGLSLYHFLQLLDGWGILSLAALGISGPLYAGFSRMHQVSLLIGMSILLGLAHLALGFFLGAVNEWNHNRRHAYGKLAWIFVELGGFVLIASMMFSVFPQEIGMMGGGLLVISIIAVALTEGPMGLIELPGLIGNALSYARIAAVGLVGVLLAELINEAFIPSPEQGLFYALMMLPLLVILHMFNICLAMAECLIQGGRLNLVEFYSKFFHGGGKEFSPFAVHAKNNGQ